MMCLKFVPILFMLIITPLMADEGEDKKEKDDSEETLKLGNLSLPTSQQPGPLVSFGQNIIDKGQTQIFLFGDYFKKSHGYASDVFPEVLYQWTDELSVLVTTPFSPRNKEDGHTSSGLEDAFIEFEYVWGTRQKRRYFEQATVVGALLFPTGSVTKNPPTGFSSYSVFLGATFSHTAVDWFYFTSHGITLMTSSHRRRTGNQLFYQAGFGRNIIAPPGWIISWMLEFDGQYNWKNKINGSFDPNSGGNTVFMTPSLWISNEKLVLQIGAGVPIAQKLFGNQSNSNYSLVFSIAWVFGPPKKDDKPEKKDDKSKDKKEDKAKDKKEEGKNKCNK